jgi:hypothetical protein
MLSRRSIALAATVASLGIAAPAYGAVTIGSGLGSPANINNCGAADCTTTNLVLNGDLAPNGLTSPVTGTVTSWFFKSGSATNTDSLRVLRPGAGVTFTGAGTSASVISVTGLNGPFTTSLPIMAGDHIGLNATNGAIVESNAVGATQLFWTMPPLADGSARPGTVAGGNVEVLVQATVEPSNVITLGKPKLKKKNGTAALTVSVPNPGLITFKCKCVKLVGSQTITAAGDVKFLLKARGKDAKKLREDGKVAIKPKFAFTPNFGVTGATQARKVTLKLDT